MTLIELIVAFTILMLLTTMAVPIARFKVCSATIRIPCRRVDSRLLLPAQSRCLIKMLPVKVDYNGRQNREATELGYQARAD